MRIAHALNGMPGGSIYGVEAHVLTLAAAQKARGHDVMAVTDKRSYFTESCEQNGIPIAIEPGLRPTREPSEQVDEETARSLVCRFKSFGVHMVHCHTRFAAWPAISAANRSGIPCAYTLHVEEPVPFERFKQLQYSVIVVSRAHLETAKRVIPPGSGPYLVPNGTRCLRSPMPEIRRPGHPNLITVGSLRQAKGTEVAIFAMSVLRQRLGPGCPVLNIFGDGPPQWVKYLKEIVKTQNLQSVITFHGNQPGILQNWPASDILLVSSRAETGPLVVLEAMSRGMPVVTTRVGEVAEMLPDERYGRIVPANSITALATAVQSTLHDIGLGKFDPALPIARHESLFSDAVMAERLDEVYGNIEVISEELIGSRRAVAGVGR